MNRKWVEIWQQSEFWSGNSPDEHFDTPSSLATGLLGRWLIQQVIETSTAAIVEIGFGNGRLQGEISRLAPGLARLSVDIRPAPEVNSPQLSAQWDGHTESWWAAAGDPELAQVLQGFGQPILVVAVEWLDDLPTAIARRDDYGRLVALGPDGPAGPLQPDDAAWAERWWPQPGRLVIGRPRDVAWAWLARHVPPGSVLATIDYGHLRSERPPDGGFTAYRQRRQVAPTEAANLTAAVAIDSLAAAVEALGCRRMRCDRLADLPEDFWSFAGADPLVGLALRSQEQLLRDPQRFGRFWLVMHRTPTGGADNGSP